MGFADELGNAIADTVTEATNPTGAFVGAKAKKKRKKKGPNAPVVPDPPDDPVGRLGWAQRYHGTMPTNAMLAANEVPGPKKELKRTYSWLEREYDIPPNMFYGRGPVAGTYVAAGGQIVTAEQATRILRVQEPKILKGIIASAIDQAERIAHESVYGPVSSPSVKDVAKVIGAMRRGLSRADLESLSMLELIGTAVQVATRVNGNKKRDILASSLKLLANQEGMDWSTKLMYAEQAAKDGVLPVTAADMFGRYGVVDPATGKGLEGPEFNKAEAREMGEAGLATPVRRQGDAYWAWDTQTRTWKQVSASVGITLENSYRAITGNDVPEVTSAPTARPNEANVATGYGGDQITRNPLVAGLTLPGDEITVLDSNRPEDYYQQSILLAKEANLEEGAWKRSPLGKLFGAVGEGLNWTYHKGVGGIYLASATLGSPFQSDAENVRDADAAYRVWNGESTLAEEWTKQGVAEPIAIAVDFAAAIATDPFFIGGRLKAGYRSLYSIPEIAGAARKGLLARSGDWFYYKTVGRLTGITSEAERIRLSVKLIDEAFTKSKRFLGNKSIPRWLTDRAREASKVDDAVKGRSLWAVASERFRGTFGPRGISPQMARTIQDIVDVGVASGRTAEELEPIVKQAMLAGMGLRPLHKGVLAAMSYEDEFVPRATMRPPGTGKPLGPPKRAPIFEADNPLNPGRFNSEWVNDVLDQVEARFVTVGENLVGGFQLEVPKVSLRSTLAAKLGETAIGQSRFADAALRRLANYVPALRVEFEAGKYSQWFERSTVRAGWWNKAEREKWVTKARKAEDFTEAGRESAMIKLVEEYESANWAKAVDEVGAPAGLADDVWKDMQGGQWADNVSGGAQYGVKVERLPDGSVKLIPLGDRPFVESQLIDQWRAIDALTMKRALKERMSIYTRTRQWLSRNSVGKLWRVPDELDSSAGRAALFGRYALDAKAQERWDKLAARALEEHPELYATADDFFAAALERQGAFVVKQGGTAAQGLSEPEVFRAMSETLGRTPSGARLLSEARFEPALKGLDRRVRTYALDAARNTGEWYLKYWKPAQIVRLGYIPRITGDEAIRSLSDLGMWTRVQSGRWGKWLGEKGWADDFIDIPAEGGQVVRIKRSLPGTLADEPFVNTGQNWDEIYESLYAEERRLSGVRKSSEWGVVAPDHKNWGDRWRKAMDQYRNGVPSRIVLEGVRSGKSAEAIRVELAKFLRESAGGRRLVKRLKIDDIDAYAKDVTEIAGGGVVWKDDIAAAVLANKHDAKMLEFLDIDQRPAVHGLTDLITGKRDPVGQMLGSLRRSILQSPTNVLSRQPFFKGWYDRLYTAQWKLLRESGVTIKAADKAAIDAYFGANARRFAIERTNAIMFDMKNQARIAELARFVAPFMQPYIEAFTVYAKLIRKNPAMVAWARHSWQAAVDSGLVHRDADTDEWVINTGPMKPIAPLLMFMSGERAWATTWLVGGAAADKFAFNFAGEDQFQTSASLSAFNMFLGNTIPADAIGLGSIAGNAPVPTPGLSPPLTALLQMVKKEDPASGLSEWLYQYGNIFQGGPVSGLANLFLPRYAENLMISMGGKELSPEDYKRYSARFQRVGQMIGWDKLGIDPNNEKQRLAWVDENVQAFYRWKTWLSFTSPAAPSIQWPTDALETEWRDLYKQKGDFGAAQQEWEKRHPDLWLIPESLSLWTDESPRGLPTAPIVPTKAADAVLSFPNIRELASTYPEVAAFLMPHFAQDQSAYDYGSYNRQIATNLRRYKEPAEFYNSAQARAGWARYSQESEAWKAWQQTHDAPENAAEYQTRKDAYDAALKRIRDQFPAFDSEFSTIEKDEGVSADVIKLTQALVADPKMSSFPIGKALMKWWAFRKGIVAEMSASSIRQIDSAAAVSLGITDRYNAFVTKLAKQVPEFEVYYDLYFGGRDLNNLKTIGWDRVRNEYPAEHVEWMQSAQAAVNDATKKLGYTSDGPDKDQLYYERMAAVNDAYIQTAARGLLEEQNPIIGLYESRPHTEQESIAVSASMRPYVFLNRFERAYILGDVTNDKAEGTWLEYSRRRTLISQESAKSPGYDTGAAYAQLNAWLVGESQGNPALAKQIENANTWGYGFFKVNAVILEQGGREGESWNAVKRYAAEYQEGIRLAGLHSGTDYNAVREQFREDVERLKEYSPTFARQWEWYEASGSGDMYDALFPEAWYPIGG